MSNVKKIIINISLLNCVLLSQSINKFESDPISTHQFSSIHSTDFSQIPLLGQDKRDFKLPMANVKSNLKAATTAAKMTSGKVISELGRKTNTKPKMTPRSSNTMTVPKVNTTSKPLDKNMDEFDVIGLIGLTLENETYDQGYIGENDFSRYGISLVADLTPSSGSYKLGPFEFNPSMMLGVYSANQSDSYNSYYFGGSNKWETDYTWGFIGLGGTFNLGGLLFIEGHLGSMNRKYVNEYSYGGSIEETSEFEESVFGMRGFMGISSKFITKKMNLPFDHFLIGTQFSIEDEDSWIGMGIRTVFEMKLPKL